MATPFSYAELARRGMARVPRGNVTAGDDTGLFDMTSYTIESGTTAETIYVALDPTQVTTIHMSHNASDTPTIDATITALETDDLELATVNYFSVYDGSSTPYKASDERPLIGLKIVANPANGDIKIDILQTRARR